MKRICFVLLIAFIAGCSFFHKPVSPYKDFSTTDGITYVKFCDLGTGHTKASPGSIIEAVVSYSKMNDSVFWSTHDKGFPYSVFLTYNNIVNGSTYERQLLKSGEGDSITYIVPADSVFQHVLHLPLPFFLHTGDMIKVNARIVGITDSAGYIAKLKAIKEYRKDMDMQEQLNLLHYVTFNNIPDSAKHKNVYIVPSVQGQGPGIVKGSQVSLCYKGFFLNGKLFDSVSVNNPLQFKCGDTAQMIEGLEIAIKMMREGEKAKIIIPSQLAFGENGSSTGIVPPYTSLVYEVTILKVK